jgi:hypothetical protein
VRWSWFPFGDPHERKRYNDKKRAPPDGRRSKSLHSEYRKLANGKPILSIENGKKKGSEIKREQSPGQGCFETWTL